MPPHRRNLASAQSQPGNPILGGNGESPYASLKLTPEEGELFATQISNTHGEKLRCNWPGCTKTFKRASDLIRHHNSVHELIKEFWCPVPGCSRSENFAGLKRSFPRKDKRDSHVKKVHKAAVSLSQSADLLATGSPRIDGVTGINRLNSVEAFSGINGVAGVDGFNNANGLANINSFPGSVSGFAIAGGFDNVNQFGNMNGLIDVSNFTGIHQLTNGLTGIGGLNTDDGFSSVGGLTNLGQLTDADNFGSANGLNSANTFSGTSAPSSADEFTNDEGFLGVDWSASYNWLNSNNA